MSRILLADDSPHAQRMGERILREEGFEVVSLTDGETSLLRLADVDPDLILADVFLPGKSGIEICRHVKNDARLRHVRVGLTAGLLEPFDEEEVMETIHPLVKEAQLARGLFAEALATVAVPPAPTPPEIDRERVQAAVTLALDAALPALVHEITERVLIALGQ